MYHQRGQVVKGEALDGGGDGDQMAPRMLSNHLSPVESLGDLTIFKREL